MSAVHEPVSFVSNLGVAYTDVHVVKTRMVDPDDPQDPILYQVIYRHLGDTTETSTWVTKQQFDELNAHINTRLANAIREADAHE